MWVTVAVFFQFVLLAGYALAHFAVGRLHFGALIAGAAGLAVFSVVLTSFDLPSMFDPRFAYEAPTIYLIAALGVGAAPAGLALAAFSPLIGVWARSSLCVPDPYRVYAASNAGCFLALVATPFVFDPYFPSSLQRSALPIVLAVSLFLPLAAVFLAGHASFASGRALAPFSLRFPNRLRVFALSAVGCALLIAYTRHASSDLPPVPLVWIVPLSIYLAAFVRAFSDRRRSALAFARLRVWGALCAIALPCTLLLSPVFNLSGFFPLFLSVVFYAFCIYVCQLALAASSPEPTHLAAFYLVVAAGGAFGGFLAGVVPSLVFPALWEFPLALAFFCAVVAPGVPSTPLRFSFGLWAAVVAIVFLHLPAHLPSFDFAITSLFAFVAAPFMVLLMPVRSLFAFAVAVFAFSCAVVPSDSVEIASARSFFGAYSVRDRVAPVPHRLLMHGTTLHGLERTGPASGSDPALTLYYVRESPLTRLVARAATPSGRIALIGLGVGSLLCPARLGARVDVYEIDPTLIALAREHFSSMSRCPPDRLVVGDARQGLLRSSRAPYDLIVVDAFSSDSVPAHLLSREALSLYAAHLAPAGVVALHVSNRVFRLWIPVAAAARSLGYSAHVSSFVPRSDTDPHQFGFPAVAVAFTLDAHRAVDWDLVAPLWHPSLVSASRVWTDDYSPFARAAILPDWFVR